MANPFQSEIDAVLAAAEAKKHEALNAPVGQHKVPWEEYKRLQAEANKLIELGLEWQQNHLASIVLDLEKMAREETARQSSIGGRLSQLADSVRQHIGGALPAAAPFQPLSNAGATVAVQGVASLEAEPSLRIPAGATFPPHVADTPPVDPNKRDSDLSKLHPVVRTKVLALLAEMAEEDVPMQVFEAYREPERQEFLYAKGRTTDGPIRTNAEPWESYHQYGLAVDMVIKREGFGYWDESKQGNEWWAKYHELARKHGLEPLSWEKPHIQMMDISHGQLLAGEYPPGGDETWADNLTAAVKRWPGSRKPPLPGEMERPPLQVAPPAAVASRHRLPPPPVFDWSNQFEGQEWRVDADGVYLRRMGGGTAPIRSDGSPVTATAVLNQFGDEIVDAAIRFDVPPELIIMIIATETGIFRRNNFTGPRTFRWEPHISDYSAGPMQILSKTARDVNASEGLGFRASAFQLFRTEPATAPTDLLLYEGKPSILIGTAFIRRNMDRQSLTANPILVSAAYNAGSVRRSSGNLWHIRSHGNHLDRAAEWYSDACRVCAEHLR